MAIRTVIACGGTGGHLFPGIAVAEALLARGGESLVLISEKEIDALATKGYDHLKFETLPAIAMPSIRSPKIIPFGFRFLQFSRLLVNDGIFVPSLGVHLGTRRERAAVVAPERHACQREQCGSENGPVHTSAQSRSLQRTGREENAADGAARESACDHPQIAGRQVLDVGALATDEHGDKWYRQCRE